ncbi:hypothetical protein QTN80_10740 [Arachnia propionica]|uniref:hypothetical protein n=1 Tax=Arachnia propionica TaxID=1750 RepID=UPI0039900369
MDKTDSQIARELALVVHGGDPAKLERAYEAYQMLSRSAASTVTYRNSTANILARAAYHRSRDLGYTVIIGNGWDASAVSGKLNHVAVDECDRLIVCETEIDGYEIWGCRRISDGTIAERGSLEYLTDLLTGDGQDPRLVQELRRLKETGSHREFFRNLAAGAVRVVYELVTVDNDGGIRYARFSPNRELLIKWGGTGPVIPALSEE